MKLSVVIRCRNEAETLSLVLAALGRQQCPFEWEVIVVDNESDDDSAQIARDFGARLVSISAQDFTYGRALNLGFSQAQGELIMALSAHSLPVGSSFLQSTVAPFDDPDVVAARCISTVDVSRICRWYRPVDVQKKASQAIHAATTDSPGRSSGVPVYDPAEVEDKVFPSNACAVYRRTAWEEIPFDETIETAEDKLWALTALERGHKIRLFSEAVYLYLKTHDRQTMWRRRQRDFIADYRIRGRMPLSRLQLVKRLMKAPLLALYRGTRHAAVYVYNEWREIFLLFAVPRLARRVPDSGSKPEFQLPTKS